MEINKQGNFNIVRFGSIEEYNSNKSLENISLIEIDCEEPELIKDAFWGTRLVTWRKEITGQDFLASIPENNRKKIGKSLRKCQKEGIIAKNFDAIPKDLYMAWLNNIYIPFANAKGIENQLNEAWYEKLILDHKVVFIFEHDTLVGASFYKMLKDNDISFSYKAVAHDSKYDLNVALENEAFNLALKYGSKNIRKGVDYNFYGAGLSTGLMKYKLKFGFKAFNYISKKTNDSRFRYIIPIRNEQFEEESLTFVSENKETILPTPVLVFKDTL